ncbi:hypothetical protein [Streptomyces sp. TP-A0356]|uniref:hypothetical protein n=1 Tax=Streptomyces sp. TP-A0356 TaxID=1359208 RepID=UPI0006E30BE7|nr:hypothetical protein [Streptomyces sp. TP-A0356]
MCFFNGYERTGLFVDITSGWQALTAGKNATGAWNTRHDDGALLHFTNGRTPCLRPGDARNDLRTTGTVDKIRITDSPSCWEHGLRTGEGIRGRPSHETAGP